MADKLPPTPELDKADRHRDEINTIMSFLEHLTFERDIVLATWLPCFADLHESGAAFAVCSESYHLVPEGGRPLGLIYEYLGLDEETMETERLTLLNHIQLTT